MNIQPISQANPSFEQLKSPRNLRLFSTRISRKDILQIPAIKNNIDRFDIVIEPKKKKKNGLTLLDVDQVMALCALSCGGFAGLSTYMLTAKLGSAILMGIFGGLAGLYKSIDIAEMKFLQSKYWEYELFGKKKYSDGTEIKTEPVSFEYNFSMDSWLDKKFVQQLKNEDKFVFMNTVTKNYPKDSLFDSKSILNILNSEMIKKDFATGEAFNYSIDVNGNETLLTKFFELPKSEAETKEYQEIVSIIKSTPNINFYQKDGAGISIVEKVFNTENSAALDLIKDLEFEHSTQIDSLFNNIKDQDFKAKARNLKIKFKDAVEILKKTKNMQDFEDAITSQLSSPFCDDKKTAMEVWKRVYIYGSKNKELLSAVNKILYSYLPENMRMD